MLEEMTGLHPLKLRWSSCLNLVTRFKHTLSKRNHQQGSKKEKARHVRKERQEDDRRHERQVPPREIERHHLYLSISQSPLASLAPVPRHNESRHRSSSISYTSPKQAQEPSPRLTLDPVPSWEFKNYAHQEYGRKSIPDFSSETSSSRIQAFSGGSSDEIAWQQSSLDYSLKQVFQRPMSRSFQGKGSQVVSKIVAAPVAEIDRYLEDAAAMATGPTAEEEAPVADPVRDKAHYDAVVARMRHPMVQDKQRQKRGMSSTTGLHRHDRHPQTRPLPTDNSPWY